MHTENDSYGRVGAILGAAALALGVRKQTTLVSPGSPAIIEPEANLIFRTTFGDTKPVSADNKWSNPDRSIFDRPISSTTKWGQQVIYNAPYTALGVRGINDAAGFLIFHIYGYVLHNSVWYIFSDTGLSSNIAGAFDTGLISISSLGVPGYSAVSPNSDRVSVGAAWDTDSMFQLNGYAEVYGGFV